ncbi:MAG: hypothetical protein JXB88_23300 [Spirochaetales bacterium]|nr:hypothetical protein [Spirochaetales bacterium]
MNSTFSWLIPLLYSLYEDDNTSIAGLKRQANEADKSKTNKKSYNLISTINQINIKDELNQKLLKWVSIEFTTRIHNLYYVQKDKDYRPYLHAFDPLNYLFLVNNRIASRAYQFLASKGIKMDPLNTPTDPYVMERNSNLTTWIIIIIRSIVLGGVLTWSFLITNQNLFLFIINIISSILILLIPNLHTYKVYKKRVGLPKFEPIGVFLIRPITNKAILLF